MHSQSLWDQAADSWIAFSSRDPNRTLLLDGPMLRLAGDVSELSVCDVGCGEGRFARMLAERGAIVTGLEPTRRLVEQARRQDLESRYARGSAESIPFVDHAFDLAVCYLVLIDIENYWRGVQEMARIVRPGGRILVANLNSFCTTRPNAWVRDENGTPLYVRVDDYFQERAERVKWAGIDILNHHRPFGGYVNAFLGAGLRLTDFEEPALTAEQAAEHPSMADAARVPLFHDAVAQGLAWS